MMLRKFQILAFGAVMSVAALLPVTADAGRIWGGPRLMMAQFALRACGGDIAKLCPHVVPGGGRIAQCLTDQYRRLSPSCRDVVERGTTARNAFFACNDAAARYCPDVRPGGGRIVDCLLRKQDLLPPLCREAILDAEETFGK